MFFEKWERSESDVVRNVVQHFKVQWTNNGLSNWSRCHSENCAINTNGLEATNRVLKDEVTHRKLLPVLDFFHEIGDWIRTQSLRRDIVNANYISFAGSHTFTTKCWTEAYHWQKDTSKQIRLVDEKYVAIEKGIKGNLTDEKARAFLLQFDTLAFASYDEFTSIVSNVRVLAKDISRAEGYSCTCKQNAKEFSCVHSLGKEFSCVHSCVWFVALFLHIHDLKTHFTIVIFHHININQVLRLFAKVWPHLLQQGPCCSVGKGVVEGNLWRGPHGSSAILTSERRKNILNRIRKFSLELNSMPKKTF